MASAVAPGSRGRLPTLRTFRRLAVVALCLAPLAAAAADLAPWSGDPKPPLALDTVDGTRRDLAELQDRPVLVHFFATWCAPCIEEMAGLKRLAAGPQGQALHIVAVDVGEVDIRVRRFRDAEGLTFPVLLDRDRAAARAWGVAGLPTTLVLDDGRANGLRAEGDVDWDAPATRDAIDRLIDTRPAATRLQPPGRTESDDDEAT